MEKYLLLAAWWFGTMVWLINGVFALLFPAKWINSSNSLWLRRHIPALSTHAILVRLLGGVSICVGTYWAVKGIQMVSGTAR